MQGSEYIAEVFSSHLTYRLSLDQTLNINLFGYQPKSEHSCMCKHCTEIHYIEISFLKMAETSDRPRLRVGGHPPMMHSYNDNN